jgi:8-oxo-dGTP diphosphatase
MSPNFTIRVYGICIKEENVLLSKEYFSKTDMLKFPGGGLEFGEGTIECLKREMQEEFGLEVDVTQHFYTTDFFVESVFHKDTQVMSIYYLMDVITNKIPIGKIFEEEKGHQLLLWQPLDGFDSESLTFPIDKKVAKLILEEFS